MNREEREAIRARQEEIEDEYENGFRSFESIASAAVGIIRQDIPALLDALDAQDARIAELEAAVEKWEKAARFFEQESTQRWQRAVALERALKKQVFACKDCVNFESRTKVFCDGCEPNDYKLWEFDQARFSGE